MLNKFSKAILFYFAYLPLFIILALNNIKEIRTIIIIIAILIIIGFVATILLLRTIDSVSASREKVAILDIKNTEYLSFLVTYLIPFFIDLSGVRQIISFSLLFGIAAYLYFQTSLFCVNPLLKIFYGYNIYEAKMVDETYFMLSRKQHKKQNIEIRVKRMDSNILVEG